MSILLKQSVTTLLPGAPGTPGTPGTPGVPPTPPSPPVCYDIVIGQAPIYVTYIWYDSLGVAHTATVIIGYQDIISHWCTSGSPGSPGYPGVPGTPAVPGLPDTALVDLQIGWNASAVSIEALAGDGIYVFSVPENVVGAVTGLNSSNEGDGYHEIDHAIYCTNGKYAVMERGVNKTAYVAYATGDQFAIRRLGDEVAYFLNSVLVYTSELRSTGSVFADASLYIAPDSIVDAAFVVGTDASLSETSGGSDGILTPITGWGGDVTGGVANILDGLTGTAGYEEPGSAYGELGGLVGESYGEFVYAICSGVLTPLVGTASAGMAEPQYAIAHGILQSLQGFSYAIAQTAGGATGILTQPVGFATNTDGAYSEGILTPLTGFGFDLTATQVHSTAYLELSGYSLFAQGYSSPDDVSGGFHGELSGYSFIGYGGANLVEVLPAITLSASGTTGTIGRATLTLPMLTLVASGTLTTLGRAELVLQGNYSVVGYGGAYLSATLPVGTLSASGITGGVGQAYLELSGYLLTASGTMGGVGSAVLTLPSLQIVGSGVLRAILPRLTLVGSAYEVLSAAYEAYSILLIPTEKGVATATTRYNNYPFDQIIRFGSTYYGVAADGLYALDGDDFNGTPIVATVQTAQTDHGTPEVKHAVALHLAGRMGADIDVTVVANEEDEEFLYSAAPLVKTGARNYRCKFGKGVKGRYWAYRFSNTAGEDFALDTMTPEVAVARRMTV